jgi:hypothetical protein
VLLYGVMRCDRAASDQAARWQGRLTLKVHAQVEYVQSLINVGDVRWHLSSSCMMEVEDRRTRLLTWLGLAEASTTTRLACLLAEVCFCLLSFTALYILLLELTL